MEQLSIFGYVKSEELETAKKRGGSVNLWLKKYDCDLAIYGKITDDAQPEEKSDNQDSARLDWVLKNKKYRFIGDDKSGWCILDTNDGLTFVVRNATTARNAIDLAMAAEANN